MLPQAHQHDNRQQTKDKPVISCVNRPVSERRRLAITIGWLATCDVIRREKVFVETTSALIVIISASAFVVAFGAVAYKPHFQLAACCKVLLRRVHNKRTTLYYYYYYMIYIAPISRIESQALTETLQ